MEVLTYPLKLTTKTNTGKSYRIYNIIGELVLTLKIFVMCRFAILIWLFCPGILFAKGDPVPFPEPPDLPPPLESGESFDPDITIIRQGEKTIQEYRVNGKLYMIKIVPDAGPAYYLVDTDGDGNMDVRRSDLEKGVQVPQWVIFSW